MIDISVNRLVKSFDLEKKILDGITFQIDTGGAGGPAGEKTAPVRPPCSESSPENWTTMRDR